MNAGQQSIIRALRKRSMKLRKDAIDAEVARTRRNNFVILAIMLVNVFVLVAVCSGVAIHRAMGQINDQPVKEALLDELPVYTETEWEEGVDRRCEPEVRSTRDGILYAGVVCRFDL